MEALQLLKFALKKEHLNFIDGWATSEVAMSGAPQVTDDLLGSLFMGDTDAAMDNVLNDFSTYDRNDTSCQLCIHRIKMDYPWS
jgi:hypothetical protein